VLSHLECSYCRERFPVALLNVCDKCGRSLYARYKMAYARKPRPQDGPGMWRYESLLPDRIPVTLGEGWTPLLEAPNLAKELGARMVWIKDEGVNPTGSFKARGMAAALTMAKWLGAKDVCVPSAGNAGGACAAYAARAGLKAHVYLPDTAPKANLAEVRAAGARVVRVKGTIADAANRMRAEMKRRPMYDVSTLKEPYRVEGKKTMGFEIAEQLGWRLPTAVLYPAGGGTGLIGMWKAFQEMQEVGWVKPPFPRMIAVQSMGCAPLVWAWKAGLEESQAWSNARTIATGLCVPKAFADWLILRILRESKGDALAVTDALIRRSMRELASKTGVLFCPEGAACWAAAKRLRWKPEEEVVIFNTGTGLKYTELL
jgi:threonine synthase